MNQLSEDRLRMRFLDTLQKNVQTTNAVLKNLAQKDAQTWCDGGDGWTVLEIACHLRDYEAIFRERGELILNEDNPPFPVYDHLALVVENEYNAQNLTAVLNDLTTSRQETLAFFNNLQDSDWQRAGQHASMGTFNHARFSKPYRLARHQSSRTIHPHHRFEAVTKYYYPQITPMTQIFLSWCHRPTSQLDNIKFLSERLTGTICIR